jgi:leucyl-tRNA synthetase
LYSRFWNKFLFDLGVVPTCEPYSKRIAHGIILGSDGRKMSKSFGNVINPDDMIKQFGADTLRAYIMFIGPYDKESAWSMDGISGVHRFLNKVWDNYKKVDESSKNGNLDHELNKLVKNIEHDLDKFLLNTYISKLMEFNNLLAKETKISKNILQVFTQLLAPAVPFLASELWTELENQNSVFTSDWPKYDEKLIASEKVTIVVQINGKVRDKFEAEPGTSEQAIKKIVLGLPNVKIWLSDKEIRKFILVPDKIVSIVL